MIEELHIRGLGVIEDSTLQFDPGLSVVTGETGAGKTMLVTALQLLLGARASTDLIRRGRDAAFIEAVVRRPSERVDRSSDAPDEIDELWELAEDDVLIVSREIPQHGRSRARIAGRLVPTSMLAALLRPHLEVHGQHEHVRLEDPVVQRRLLDAYGGDAHREVLQNYRTAYAAWAAAVRREQMLQEDAMVRAERLAQLRSECSEIDAVALDPSTDAFLDQEIDRLANADALREAVVAAHAAAGTNGALESLGEAVAALRRAPVDDRALEAFSERLAAVSRDLSEVVADLAGFADGLEADDARLDRLQGRKRELTALFRRYGASIADVLQRRDDAARAIADLEELEQDATSIADQVSHTSEVLQARGTQLTHARREVGAKLVDVVHEHLRELGLEHATLLMEVHPTSAGSDGADRVEMLLAANPGEAPARLANAASGGERSRVALALEVALATQRGSGILVFDEVDAGVGGSTALAVGRKMALLTRPEHGSRQVLCVTHLAQVAAFADQHFVVEKHVHKGRTTTQVRPVPPDERATEISRMLGGEATAEAGLEHARSLLEAARLRRGP